MKRLLLFLTVVLVVWMFSQGSVEAAGSADNGETVADYLKGDHSSKTDDEKQEKKDLSVSNTPKTAWMFIKVIFVLALVIALIYLLLRFVHARTKSFADGRAIQSIGGVNVAANRSVQLVKVGERILVIGVGESVSLLKEIDDASEVEKLLVENTREDVIDHSIVKFRDWFKRARSPKQGDNNFKAMLEDRLNQMMEERKKTAEQLKNEDPGK
jgi:flagellar protein FliO/FliZ